MYSHCAGHCLNLVIVHSCKIPFVRNTIDKMKEVCLFFNYSPKREGLLQSVISKEVLHAEKRKPLLNLCATGWAERHSAYSHFYASYVYMVYSLEVIAHGLHQDKGYDHVQGNWAFQDKARCIWAAGFNYQLRFHSVLCDGIRHVVASGWHQ